MKKLVMLSIFFLTSNAWCAAQKPSSTQPAPEKDNEAAFVLANMANFLMNFSTIAIHTSHAHHEGQSPDPHVVAPAAANMIGSFFNIVADMVSKNMVVDRHHITAQDIEEYFLAQDPDFISKLQELIINSGQTIATTSCT